MNKLINRKVLISMIFIGLTMMGLFSYRYLLMELYPDAEFPSLKGGGTEKDFIGFAVLSTPLFPLKGEVSNHKGIFDE